MEKTVLITGGTGFIGSHLSSRLYNLGYNVTVVGSATERKPRANKFLYINLNGLAWDKIGKVDICFHLAAHNDTTDTDRDNMYRANLTGPMTMFHQLAENGCKKFIYASSASVYGNSPAPYVEDVTPTDPLNPYAESKLAFDDFARHFALDKNASVIGLRFTNVYGPGEWHKGKRASMIHQLIEHRRERPFVRPRLFKYGEQKRDWVYVDDAVDMMILAIDYPHSGIFNCGSGEAVSFNQLAEIIGLPEAEYIDCPFPERYQSFTLADLTKSKKELKYSPKYNVNQGIKKFIEAISWPVLPAGPYALSGGETYCLLKSQSPIGPW